MKFLCTRSSIKALLAVAVALSTAACASSSKPRNAYANKPVEAIYNEASDNLSKENYQTAAKLYQDVERQYPYSVWAGKAQLMASHAYYLQGDYTNAVDAAQRYIQLHTGSEDSAYAYYLVALAYYAQINDVRRGQGGTNLALKALNEVVTKFPNTQYARDAKLKIDLAREQLAGHDLLIGRYYEKREEYLAAINRYRDVVETYQTTKAIPEALSRLVECYLALGLKSEAQAAAAVLGHNYPGSPWYQSSYALLTGAHLKPKAERGSWLSGLF